MSMTEVSPNMSLEFHDAMTDLLLKELIMAGEPLSVDYLMSATGMDRDKINKKLADCKHAYTDHLGRWAVNFDE